MSYMRRNANFVAFKYLHCTSRYALALITVSTPFSAKHQYSPDWFLRALKLNVSPVATVFPSLSHVILGAGLPVAVHWNEAMSASLTV